MRAIALGLLLAVAGAEAAPRSTSAVGAALDRYRGGRERFVRGGPVSTAADPADPYLLEFATSSSASAALMGEECACASVAAGTNGEVVSATRASAATCTIGNWLTGIDTGDVVFCAADQVRVMSGGGSTLGFLSEGATHNYVTEQDMTAAPWTTVGTGGLPAPTISPPDAGLCPDGTNTATRVILPANTLSPAQQSVAYTLDGCQGGGVVGSGSAYVRGYSADGGSDWYVGGTYAHFGYAGATWTRILNEGVTMSGAGFSFGNLGYYLPAQLEEPAADYLICWKQCETKDHATSYTANDRAADKITAAVKVPLGSDLQFSADLYASGAVTGGAMIAQLAYDYATHFGPTKTLGPGLSCRSTWSSITDYVPDAGSLGTIAANAPNPVACGWTGRADFLAAEYPVYGCAGATCADGGVRNLPLYNDNSNAEILEIGGHTNIIAVTGSQPDGVISNIQIASAATKDVYLFGDSIVGGATGRDVTHHEMYALRGTSVALQNHGSSGDTIEQIKVRWDATTAAIRAHPSNASRTYMMVQGGTNNSSGPDAGVVIDALRTMLWDARDAGAHVLWSTITPRDDNCEYIKTVNAAMQSWCTAAGVAQADTYTPLWQGPACEMNPALGIDSLHPNDAGTVLMFNAWRAAGGW